MRFTRHTFSILIFSIIASVCVFSVNVYGSSLYAITDCQGGNLTVYEIQGERIDYQIDTDIGSGSIGLALDPASGTLFATYDYDFSNKNQIVLINAKTMQQIKSIPLSYELAGIVYDQERQKLYATSRDDKKLYVYLWNSELKTLTLDKVKTLDEIPPTYSAFGVALDEMDKILYVTDLTNSVKCYDANDPNFGYLDSIDITVNSNGREAVGIDFYRDPQGNKYLYTGAWMHDTENEYLVQTNSTDPNWVLVTSNSILRANLCEPSDWYDNVFNPCGNWPIRYWELPPGASNNPLAWSGQPFSCKSLKTKNLE